jgi:uncharacterized protein (DUF1015 family)
MALLKPFAALRPDPQLAEKICELPYDVMSSDEARQIAAGNPLSFLHVSKPEIDLPPGMDVHDPRVYAKGRENFDRLVRQGALRRESSPAFYLYRQIMGWHTQTGLVAAASCDDYLRGVVKKHELTRPDKEDDRVRHIEALNSQTGPVFLLYRAVKELDELVAAQTATAPDTDFTAADGVRHSSWTLRDDARIEFVRRAFANIPALYIADGHHRCAAAARVCQARRGAGQSAFFLSVIFPDNQIQIMPYNRVLKDLNGLTPEQLLEKLAAVFYVSEGGPPSPAAKHEMALYLEGRWRTLRFRPQSLALRDAPLSAQSATSSPPSPPHTCGGEGGPARRSLGEGGGEEAPAISYEWGRSTLPGIPQAPPLPDPAETLDATLLQKLVLAPIFGIGDPRSSRRVHFVGGIRGPGELEKLVDTNEFACAFSLFPAAVADLLAVADAGGVMPPKSTWFEPKLRDAMFCHNI